MAVGAGRDDADVVRVLDGRDDAGSENDLLPGLADVEDVDACARGRGGQLELSRVEGRRDEDAPSERRFQTYGSIFFSTFLVLQGREGARVRMELEEERRRGEGEGEDGPDVGLSLEEEGDVLLGSLESSRKTGSHL